MNLSNVSYSSTIVINAGIVIDCSRELDCFSSNSRSGMGCSIGGFSSSSNSSNSCGYSSCCSGVSRSETIIRSTINLPGTIVVPSVRFSMYDTSTEFFCWQWTPLMRSRLLFTFVIVSFLILFFSGYLILTTSCFIDGMGALALVASSFLTVLASIFSEDFSERGLRFQQQGFLPSTKCTHLGMNTQ